MFKNVSCISVAILAFLIVLLFSLFGCNSTPKTPLTFTASPEKEIVGYIYIGGEVYNPGYYPLTAADSVATLINAAGGNANNSENLQIELIINKTDNTAQKVNINRAEAWLLEALPGIGKTRANAIIQYRNDNGNFKNVNELLKVEGIGQSTFDNIKELITVGN
ncbi:MAG: ComEA family DNA-binding protein [Dehalococcoidales bacterium]